MRSSLTALLLLAACAPAVPVQPEPSPETLRIEEGGEVRASDLRIRFLGVENDSRCHPGVQCIREGEAKVLLEVATRAGGPDRLRLWTSPPDSAAAAYGTYRLRLDSLSARPSPGGRYRAWIRLGRRD
jgi:hypothetical protein